MQLTGISKQYLSNKYTDVHKDSIISKGFSVTVASSSIYVYHRYHFYGHHILLYCSGQQRDRQAYVTAMFDRSTQSPSSF